MGLSHSLLVLSLRTVQAEQEAPEPDGGRLQQKRPVRRPLLQDLLLHLPVVLVPRELVALGVLEEELDLRAIDPSRRWRDAPRRFDSCTERDGLRAGIHFGRGARLRVGGVFRRFDLVGADADGKAWCLWRHECRARREQQWQQERASHHFAC